jgi:RNA polymerase sigma-70 factor (ECF subfamily)
MTQDDRQLVRRSRAGDRSAFGALYDRHAARVFHLLRRLTGNVAEAEDLTQETFLAAYGALDSWRGEGAFATWLCGIAFRQYAGHRRRQARQETESLDDEPMLLIAPDADPLAHYERQEQEARIEAAIAALPPLCREVFVLVKVEGLPYREAALWLGVPLGTVQSRLFKAVSLLRAALVSSVEDIPKGASEPGSERQGGKQDAVQERA